LSGTTKYFFTYFNFLVGVSWADMHKLANRVLLSDLRDAGLLQGDIDDMLKVSAVELCAMCSVKNNKTHW
jgi:hypothetical protein